MIKKAILGRLHFQLEESLFEEIAAIRSEDPFGEINVVAGSNTLCVYLRKELARKTGGFFNVRFLTFADLVYLLSAAGSENHRATAPRFTDTVIARGIAGSSLLPACFEEVAGTKGFTKALLSTFSDLAEASCSAEWAKAFLADAPPSAGLNARMSGLLSLYAAYRERLESRGSDVHVLFENAIDAARDYQFEHPILTYGFYDFNELQWRLIEVLGAGSGVKLFMPWKEGEESYRFASRAIDLISKCGFDQVKLNGMDEREKPAQVRLFSAPGKEEEAREIVRRILNLVSGRGIGFGEIAILLPSQEAYASIVCEILDEAGIPYFASGSSALEQYAAGRALLHLLTLLRGKIERRNLVDFLVSAPLAIEDASPSVNGGDTEASFDPFQAWVRASAETGMMGATGWQEENAALTSSLRGILENIVSEKRAEEIRNTIRSTRLVGDIINKILQARDLITDESRWSGFSTIIRSFVQDIFEPSEGVDSVCSVIDDLKQLDSISNNVSFELFSHILESALAAPVLSRGRFADCGVNVLPIGQARGCSFRAVFIPGLSETIIPGKVVQDPFLMDHERKHLGEMSGGEVRLSEKSGRIEEEALLFALALDSAREELVCSYPRNEDSSGKQMMPSSFLRFIPGYTLDGTCEESLVCERLSRYHRDRAVLEPVSEHEYDFLIVRGFRNGEGCLPVDPIFRRAASLINARWGKKEFTPYDGVFVSPAALRELEQILDHRGWRFSPTSMERYAGCPFKYLLNNLLELEPTEEPERLITITPLQRGELVHRILALLYSELQNRDLLPLNERTAREAREIAEQITTREMEEYPKSEPVGLAVFWEMEKRMITESVRLLLDEELGEGDEYMPTYFEKPFGMKGESVQVPFTYGKRTVHFHGRIDRVDIGPEDKFRVIDFKTGRLNRQDQDLAGGSNLQLPIYLLAASKFLKRRIQYGEAVYRRVGVSVGKRTVVFTGRQWERTEKELGRIIDVITRGIENGIFFAPAEDRSCSFCEMRPACPTGRSGFFETKAKHDSRSIDYLAMRMSEEVDNEK